ncbi:hypothetical protein QBC33DRAFT_435210, partial [Phialemonium atrogriseum]
EDQHQNHEASTSVDEHVAYRGFTEDQKKSVAQITTASPAVQSRDVARIIRSQYPEAVFTNKDLENLRAHQKKEARDGYTPTQSVIRSFEEEGIKHEVLYDSDGSGRIVGL